MPTVDKVIKSFKLELKEIYPLHEISAMITIVFEHFLDFSKTDLILNANQELSEYQYDELHQVIERLKNQEPLQYILGETYFYNLKFKVSPAVLIPRQETEELVDWILKENIHNQHLHVLDIGTGSGCIAISLAANLKNAEISAFDISEIALEIAAFNAKQNHVQVDFQNFDILNHEENNEIKQFDIIVSNPPYVLDKEKHLMHRNVLDFEPSLALFVDEHDPLLFYKAIVQYSDTHLKKEGTLFFEINEAYGNELENLLIESGFNPVELKKDLNGKNRMLSGKKL